jgi:proline dehydrogenase
MNGMIKEFASRNWQVLAKRAGQAYVSGPELNDALRNCRHLSHLGFASTVCYWNLSDDSPRQIADACIEAILALAEEHIDGYVSVKLPPLKFDGVQLGRILTEASRSQILVHFDAHGPETAELSFAAITNLAAIHQQIGCTLPGRWERSCLDAEMAVDLGLHVRVVKGQWLDPDHPNIDPSEGFLRVIDCLAGRARSVAVATHDPQVGRLALERLQRAGTPCVLELLYGLPRAAAIKLAEELAVPVRIYIPFGYGWLPYTLGQARRNPKMLWWILRDYVNGVAPLGKGSVPGKTRKPYS